MLVNFVDILLFIAGMGPLICGLMLRDVTHELARQHRELACRKLLEERRQLRQQELLIRDLHDGVGGIVAAIAMLSALGLREPDRVPPGI